METYFKLFGILSIEISARINERLSLGINAILLFDSRGRLHASSPADHIRNEAVFVVHDAEHATCPRKHQARHHPAVPDLADLGAT